MLNSKIPVVGAAILLAVSATSYAIAANPATEVISVTLQDATNDPAMVGMKLTADRASVKAGKVIFKVSNDSKSVVHEMIVVKLADAGAELPYDEKTSKVVEDKIVHLGEAADLKPGTVKSLALTLKPGAYMLICNQPGHFHAAMRADLTVTQ